MRIAATLPERVERLERQNRRLKFTCSLLLLAAFGVIALGQAANKPKPSQEVTATRIVLLDGAGKKRARFEVKEYGFAGLEFLDPKGNVRLQQGVRSDGTPFLAMYGPNDVIRASLGVANDGRPGIGLWGNDGKPVWGAPGASTETQDAPRKSTEKQR